MFLGTINKHMGIIYAGLRVSNISLPELEEIIVDALVDTGNCPGLR